MSEQLQLQPMNSWGKSTSSYVPLTKELIMKKALYYDFMLYKRILKPFNSFLVQNGLQNSMYQQVVRPPVIPALASSLMTTTPIVKNEDLLHESLQQFLAQEAQEAVVDNIDTRVFNLEQLFKMKGLNNKLFTPKTSDQIDANIGLLVSNITAGITYDCSTDAIMSAIMNGRFDDYLSEQNKEQMMQICGPVPVAEAEATAEATSATAEKQKGFSFKSLFGLGGRKMKRSKKRYIKRSKKRYIKRSKKRSNRRSIKRSKSNKKYRGGYEGMFNVPPPPSYLGSIQGKYMNLDGKQLMTNPTDGIA